tara:strand:+ start:1710 stop:2279 length:570 start_codon:yes stop_codon:yes gene_type:complete
LKEQNLINQYIDLIQSWNSTHNLVSKDQSNNLQEHIEDSLSVFNHTGPAVVDIGSGGGFPGIPIAIKGPERRVVLVDSNQKKTSFLLNSVNKLGLKNVTIINARIEDVDPSELPQNYELIARALGTIQHIIGLTKNHLKNPNTKLKLMKTKEQMEDEKPPPGYTIKKIHKLPSKEKDKERILVTIEKDG